MSLQETEGLLTLERPSLPLRKARKPAPPAARKPARFSLLRFVVRCATAVSENIFGTTTEWELSRRKLALALEQKMRVISFWAFIQKPTFWVLTGTVMMPLNLFFAFGFWLRAKWFQSKESAAKSARLLNVQLTYTLVFFLPILLAFGLSSPVMHSVFPNGAIRTQIAGILFGLVGLSGVGILIFANTRTFAGDVLGHDVSSPTRLKFVPEA